MLQENCATVSLENKIRKRETKCNSFSSVDSKPVTENFFLRISCRYVLMIFFVVTVWIKENGDAYYAFRKENSLLLRLEILPKNS